MLKYFLNLVTYAFAVNFIHSQEILFDDGGEDISNYVLNHDTKTISQTNGKEIDLTFVDNQRIWSFLIDDNYNLIDKIAFIKTGGTDYYKLISSFGNVNEKNALVFSRGKQKKIYLCSYDYKNEKTDYKVLDLRKKGEKFIGSFPIQDKYYLIYFLKKTKELKIYTVNTEFQLEYKIVKLEDSKFLENKLTAEISINKDKILSNIYSQLNLSSIPYISDYTQNSSKDISASNRLFASKKRIKILLDLNPSSTCLIDIDLMNYTSEISNFYLKKIDNIRNEETTSSSFVKDSLLFLMKGNKKKVVVEVFNLNTKEYISNLSIDKDGNTSISSNPYFSNRILNFGFKKENIQEKKKFISKKMKNVVSYKNRVGISINQIPEAFLISIIGHQEYLNSYSNSNLYQVSSNTQYLNFYLSESDFKPQGLVISPFMKMDSYLNKLYSSDERKLINVKLKFKKNDDFILGYLDKRKAKYYLRKFN